MDPKAFVRRLPPHVVGSRARRFSRAEAAVSRSAGHTLWQSRSGSRRTRLRRFVSSSLSFTAAAF